jgi:hypothetical protein
MPRFSPIVLVALVGALIAAGPGAASARTHAREAAEMESLLARIGA